MAYALSRGYAASARLDLQHFLWAKQCGWLVHPSVPLDRIVQHPSPKIADVGTGTGIWLIDLSEAVPPSVQLDGFDISLAQAPPPAFLPHNVHCHALDGFGELPGDLVGQYDFVHVRLFVHACPGGEPLPLLRNAIKMLKPGGYLMWADIDVTSPGQHYSNGSSTQTSTAHEKFYAIPRFLEEAHERNISAVAVTPTPSWIPKLPDLFKSNGLSSVTSCRHPTTRAWATVIQEIVFLTWEEISHSVLDKYPNGEGAHLRKLIQEAYQELREGNAVASDRLTVVGQKLGQTNL